MKKSKTTATKVKCPKCGIATYCVKENGVYVCNICKHTFKK